MSTKHAERGTIHTRRNVAEFNAQDPYATRVNPGEVAVCTECHALYQRRHWFYDEELYFSYSNQTDTNKVLCPACQKIRDRYAEGQVTLRSSAFLTNHKEEILHLVRNEEERAKGINPLERIIEIAEAKNGIVITTTNEKMAQRIGRAVRRAYQGETSYHWSDPKFLTVEWQRAE
jgi:NMD protein affecting ribosome stability and mRNA decay